MREHRMYGSEGGEAKAFPTLTGGAASRLPVPALKERASEAVKILDWSLDIIADCSDR